MKNEKSQIKEFINHIKRSTNEMLDIIDTKSEYENRFDVTITINNKSITLGNHSELYENLMNLLYAEIEEEEPNHVLEVETE